MSPSWVDIEETPALDRVDGSAAEVGVDQLNLVSVLGAECVIVAEDRFDGLPIGLCAVAQGGLDAVRVRFNEGPMFLDSGHDVVEFDAAHVQGGVREPALGSSGVDSREFCGDQIPELHRGGLCGLGDDVVVSQARQVVCAGPYPLEAFGIGVGEVLLSLEGRQARS